VSDEGLRASVEKMRAEGVADVAIRAFEHYYRQLEAGETGLVPEDSIEPATGLPEFDELPHDADAEREALQKAIVLRLNGGLGTSMGLTGAKSLLEAKDGNSFLDIIARQVLALRERFDARLPLVLMNSFSTRDDSLKALEAHPGLDVGLPLDFLQNKEPKLLVDDLTPVEWPDDPALEWCPPGHGDLYTALVTSGMLEQLLEQGFEYAFVANSDNLGAVLDPRILAWLRAESIPFAMEVTDRTEADRKGGHLAVRRSDGRLVLRETAQTPDEDREALEDITRHRYVNTNNLWVSLRALDEALRDGFLELPMIRNEKTVDPSDSSSPAVYQLETAMGAAIEVFEGARALRVPRTRFAPVKTTDDLLALRSDAYELTGDARMVLADGRSNAPFVALDSEHYKLLRDFEERFPSGPPSLVECNRFEVEGDVHFGAGVIARGDVLVSGPATVEDGAEL
jgi:UTP--glucose-1-phosphate uridylyltransferase